MWWLIGLCIVLCIMALAIGYSIYLDEKDYDNKKRSYEKRNQTYEQDRISTFINSSLRQLRNDFGDSIEYQTKNDGLTGEILYTCYGKEFLVEFSLRKNDYSSLHIKDSYNFYVYYNEQLLKSFYFDYYKPYKIKEFIKSHIETLNLFNELTKKYNHLIIEKDFGHNNIIYNHIPLAFGIVELDEKFNTIVLTNSKDYTFVYGSYFSSREMLYNKTIKEIDSIDDFEKGLKEIEDELLYDLSHFQDAFNSIVQVPINGYLIDAQSIKTSEDYTLEFDYKSNTNTYHFSVKPFERTYSYHKNDFNTRYGEFRDFEHLMENISNELNKSKKMLPFEYEEKPTVIYDSLSGELKISEKLPYSKKD